MFGSTINSFMQQQPQQNQYLQGNPETNPTAQTDWMNPENSIDNSGFNGGSPVQTQPNPTSTGQNNGTALGSIASGSFGSAPLGFEQDKWNDPNQGNSLKYQVGRMAAQGMPIDQIASKVGAKVISPDKIQYPDGFIADIYFDYGGPNQRVQYLDQTPSNDQSSGQMSSGMNSFMGNSGNGQMQNQNFQQFMNQLMQQLFSAQQGQRFNNQGQPNQSGGFIPPTGGFSGWGSGNNPTPNIDNGSGFNKFPGQNPFQQPTPDANGYYGGWQDENGVRHSGNQPDMSYLA